MKAVILAAGKGTRLKPLTDEVPKVLVPIKGKPFLQYLLDNVKAAGITDILVVVGYKKEKVIDFLKTYDEHIQTIEQEQQRGTGDIAFLEPFVSEPFLFLYGDGLISVEDVQTLMKGEAAVLAKEVEHPEQYGVLVTKAGFLQEIVEKPKTHVGNLINAGMYVFPPQIFSHVHNLSLSSRGELELTDALTSLAKEIPVKVLPAKEWLHLSEVNDIAKIEHSL